MATYHVRAVQEHSNIIELKLRHTLEIICLDIGEDDSPAYTSNRKIAHRARCSVNTVRDRIKKLVGSGELIARKEGKYTLYSLNPNLVPYSRTQQKAQVKDGARWENAGIITKSDLIQLEQRLYQQQKELYQSLYQNQQELYQSLYQNNVSIVSTAQTSNDNKEGKCIGKGEVIGKVSHAQDTPQSYRNFEKLHEVKTPLVEELEQAIKKCVLDSTSLEKINDTAYIAIANDVTPEDILKGFKGKNSYWFTVRYGKDGQKPWCKNIQQEMVAAKEWKPKANGIAPKEKYEPIMEVGYEL